ncbi:MAG: DAK2 domain-containing protein [Clostridia bacterium]|nr:DAK2 domain-containing protein [Clostridia bacterium]
MDNSSSKIIDGQLFEQIALSGANNLKANLKTVNDLNVFPIPDGDTGDNMYMTIAGGIAKLKSVDENSVGKKARALADGMLLNARGNSGVILSQLFAGIADGLEKLETATVEQLGRAFKCGVCKAYGSVSQPVEGTILTVAREATDYACDKCCDGGTIGKFFDYYINEMKASLERTPDLLEALREAGVIDSGGAGLVYIAEGMKCAIEGKKIESGDDFTKKTQDIDFSRFNENTVMKFGYCTELLLQLTTAKTDVTAFKTQPLIDYLESIGDSVVCFITGTVVKLHVHTLTPHKVLEYCSAYGEFLTIKIENMTLQHNGTVTEEKKPKRKRARRKFALVTVATGKGLTEVFTELGADEVIDGGQGKNPSIERFIEAFDDVNADEIFVLPNNGNIIMAAKQASELYKDSIVHVIPTKNFGHAYAILSMLDYSLGDGKAIAEQMISDMADAVTGMVTSSIRDANIDGVEIENGDYIGFSDKVMLTANKDKTAVYFDLADKLDAKEKAFMIVAYGDGVTAEEKKKIEQGVSQRYPDLEFYQIDGGQEVYDFIVILE